VCNVAEFFILPLIILDIFFRKYAANGCGIRVFIKIESFIFLQKRGQPAAASLKNYLNI